MTLGVDADHATGRMKKVAVFGHAGGGTSTLTRHLAALTRLPLYPWTGSSTGLAVAKSLMRST